MRWASPVVLALTGLCAAKPLVKRWDNVETKHAWEEVPRGWVLHGPSPANHTLRMTIGLKQNRLDELIASLYQVSDPAHERYGAHLTKEEVEALVAPHPDSLVLVRDWLSHHGIDMSSAVTHFGSSSWLALDVPVSKAERMLDTTYNTYYNPSTDTYVVRTVSYALPRILHGHVDVITPTTYFGNMRMKATSFLQPHVKAADGVYEFKPGSDGTVPASCGTTITPSCLRALYNTADYVPKATYLNKLGITGYLNQFANRADLQTFFSKFRTDATGATYTTTLVNGGGDNQTRPGIEANLDIQYTEGISFPTPNTYYSTGGSPPFIPDINTPTNTNEPYLDWLNFILAQTTIPQTFTTSYGEDEQTVPHDYAVSVCNLFAQLGARGSSIMFPSGDSGVGPGDCLDRNNMKHFQPEFPASCPFVTTVGGTSGVNPEVAVDFSGGGFSNYFAQPTYQKAAVSTFLAGLGTQFAGFYNASGRAYPDVAAQGQSFQIVVGGVVKSASGTSASAPTFAAVVSLLNDFRLAHGKTSLGFLNPLIYAAPIAFNDITSGSNPGCGTAGFTAGVGWDPVTGFGTPDFLKMQTLLC